MNTLIRERKILEQKEELYGIFRSGFKLSQKLGVEFEKLPVKNSDFTAVPFFFNKGILDFLNNYKEQTRGVPIYENDALLGIITNMGTITLEPGCQVEMSLRQHENICDIEEKLNRYNELTSKIADDMGFSFLALGCQPVSTFENIKIIPKSRYEFMTKYLGGRASRPYVMMRETAGIQTSIDYKDEFDAIQKLSTALKLSPFLSAFYVNSPIRQGSLSGYKSYRLHAWLNTDNKRCGLVSKKLIETPQEFSFEDYTDILLDVPMIFHKNKYVENKTFKELFIEKEADESDWETHLSLFFPDVRLKNYIEIRNHDCQNPKIAISVPTLYKGIFYSKTGIDDVNSLLKEFTYYDLEFVRQNAPRFGMDFCVKNFKISTIVKEIFYIAQRGLKEFELGEEKYLDNALELVNESITPADIIIKNFEGSWHHKIEKLVKFSQIN
ncbi:MAG: hypothetical protein K6A44_04310 [bacterium]|nr:hypothetical protein [bacterium]